MLAETTQLRIVVNEYPKAGGSWVVNLVGDALDLPKRDIYVSDSYRAFDVRKHPWYISAGDLGLTPSCVIKSHEMPNSPLEAFDARHVHLVRDGRDVVVSKYFYERDFCVKNGIYAEFNEPFDDYVPRVAAEWRAFVLAWLDTTPQFYRYEDFRREPLQTLRGLCQDLCLEVPESQICAAIAANGVEQMRRALAKTFAHNTFVRKACVGDWRNHFRGEHTAVFHRIAGDTLARLGYDSAEP
jgi:hypothetical protein